MMLSGSWKDAMTFIAVDCCNTRTKFDLFAETDGPARMLPSEVRVEIPELVLVGAASTY